MIKPEDASARIDVARALYAAGLFDAAREQVVEALGLDSSNADAYELLNQLPIDSSGTNKKDQKPVRFKQGRYLPIARRIEEGKK